MTVVELSPPSLWWWREKLLRPVEQRVPAQAQERRLHAPRPLSEPATASMRCHIGGPFHTPGPQRLQALPTLPNLSALGHPGLVSRLLFSHIHPLGDANLTLYIRWAL